MLPYEITRMMAVERQTDLLAEAEANRLARRARRAKRWTRRLAALVMARPGRPARDGDLRVGWLGTLR
jgi:hypothetical protein